MTVEQSNMPKIRRKVIRIPLEETLVPTFKLMIEYLYTGTVALEEEKFTQLIALANEYNIDPLKESCVQVLGKNINENNIFLMLDIIERYRVTQLRLMVRDFLSKNFNRLATSGMLLQLDIETWKQLVKDDELMVDSEEQVFHSVMSYAEQFSTKEKTSILEQLFPYIRFGQMEPRSLVDIEENKELKDIPVLAKLLFESYRFKSNPKAGTTMLRTEPRRSTIPLKDAFGLNYPHKNNF